MKKLSISAIIPAYNEERYIAACLTALTHQSTQQPYEIIVVDNNSTDSTANIVASFPTVRLINQPVQGLAVTRNFGAKAAKGDILLFIDADCVVQPHHLEFVAALFQKYPDVSALTGPYIYVDGGPMIQFFTQICQYFRWYFYFMETLFGLQILIGGNVAFRKRAFVELNGFDESITDINDPEDLEIALRCKKNGLRVIFDHTIGVISSYRRLNRALLKEGFIRTFYRNQRLWKYLTCGV